jgi:histone H3/H4
VTDHQRDHIESFLGAWAKAPGDSMDILDDWTSHHRAGMKYGDLRRHAVHRLAREVGRFFEDVFEQESSADPAKRVMAAVIRELEDAIREPANERTDEDATYGVPF